MEFKCNHACPEEIGEYVSALANTAALECEPHAYLVWGVSDGDHQVVGTSFLPSQTKKGNEELENWLLHLLTPQPALSFHEFRTQSGLPVAMITIDRATHQPVRFRGVGYIRVGTYKKKLADHPEKERQLWRAFQKTSFEDEVAAELVPGSDVLRLLDYPSYFRLLGLPLPADRDAILGALVSDRMVAARPGGRWDILDLGAILFATRLAHFQHLSRKAVRLVEYEGEGRVRTRREHQGQQGYAADFEGLIALLNSMLPRNEVIGQALRETVPMYPEQAVRELVANMIIHQDFRATGTGPMVEVFLGRLEVTNPGEPLMDTRRLVDTPPQSRNEVLASFLRRAGICEERGSGIDKVVSQTEFYQLPAPLFERVSGHTRATLFAHRPFADMDRGDRIRACYLHACLQCVQRRQLTNTSLRGRFGISEQNRAQVSRVIADTVSAGLLRLHDPESGSRRHARYVPFWA